MTARPLQPDSLARAAFLVLLPAAAASGALALAVLICLAGVAALRPSLLRQAVEKPSLALLLLLAFVAWVLISTAWSPYAAEVQALKFALLAPLGLLFAAAAVQPEARRLTQAGGLAAFIVLAALLAIEALWGMPLSRAAEPEREIGDLGRNLARGVTVLAAMTWAAVGALLAYRTPLRAVGACAVLAVSGTLAFQFDMLAIVAAFAVGLVAFAAAYAAPRTALMTVAVGLALWMAAAPFLTPLLLADQRILDALPLSWAARVGIWDYACTHILDQPWIGHGLEASRAVTDRIQVRELNMRGIPVHPHSASLQIWYETGAVGAALAAAALLAGGRALARALGGHRASAAAACGTLASLGLIANVSYGLWAEWWIATLFIAAALVGAVNLRLPR